MSNSNPRFGVHPYAWIYHPILNARFRSLLSLGLAALIFLTPLSASVSAQTVTGNGAQQGSKTYPGQETGKVHGFIIEMGQNGTLCRDASQEELRYVMAPLDAPRERITVRSFKSASDSAHAKGGSQDDIGGAGLTINFNVLSQLNTDANKTQVIAAFERAAQYWTNRIKSPVTVEIDIDYGPNRPGGGAFGPGVLGSTGSASVGVDYAGARHNLIAAANASESALLNSLPTTVLPTDTGNGGIVDVPASVAKALGVPTASGRIASIAFNKNFQFDFNPDDGITGNRTDFVAVATHEIGHALGFVSGAGEGASATPTTWDLFRFRPGTTSGTFTTAQRIMSRGGEQVFFTGQNFLVSGLGTNELGLSTGGPDGSTANGGDGNQSSHWKDDEIAGGYVGIMDPTIARNVRQEPTENDYIALEAMGWDLIGGAPIPGAPPAPPPPANDNFAAAQALSGCSGSTTGTNVGATQEAGEPNDPQSSSSTRSVWYQWTAPSTGTVTVDTIGSGFDTVLAVYTYNGSGFGGLGLVGSNDDNEDPNTDDHEVSSLVSFSATQGAVYRISVNGFNNGGGASIGSIKLNWSQTNCSVSPTPTPAGDTIQIASASTPFNEATVNTAQGYGVMTVQVSRSNPAAGAATVQYFTEDAAGGNDCTVVNGSASQRCDYATAAGTLRFAAGEASKTIQIPVVPDGYVEGNESFTLKLQNPTGATLGTNSQATLVIQDRGVATTPAQNPYMDNSFFTRQLYLDILGREPDVAGFADWTNVLNTCGPEKGFLGAPRTCDRAFVSHGFVASPEFTDRGYHLHRMYEVGARRLPRYSEFVPEMAGLSGAPGSAELEQNTAQYAENFVLKPEFVANYGAVSGTAQAAQFITLLEQNAGVTLPATTTTLPGQPTQYNRQDLINKRASGEFSLGKTLRAFIEQKVVYDKFFERGFVTIQYFGFLKRDPNLNDPNLTGWTEWVFVFTNGGAARNRPDIGPRDVQHLVFGFIYSEEYRKRFGQP